MCKYLTCISDEFCYIQFCIRRQQVDAYAPINPAKVASLRMFTTIETDIVLFEVTMKTRHLVEFFYFCVFAVCRS